MTINLRENERLDDLNRCGYQIIQNTEKFCFGMDAVLLTGFANIKKNDTVLDMGTGTGVIPILLEAKTEAKSFKALEIQEESADMARRSVEYNNLQNKIEIINGDIKEASSIFGAASFDVVTCNPPYMNNNHGLKNGDMAKAIARHEILCSLEDVVSQASKVLREGGRFYMVHRPFRMAEIINMLMRYRMEPKRIRLVYPYDDKEPNMILIESVKGAKSMVKVEPPLIVYKKDGTYTDEIYRIYYD